MKIPRIIELKYFIIGNAQLDHPKSRFEFIIQIEIRFIFRPLGFRIPETPRTSTKFHIEFSSDLTSRLRTFRNEQNSSITFPSNQNSECNLAIRLLREEKLLFLCSRARSMNTF